MWKLECHHDVSSNQPTSSCEDPMEQAHPNPHFEDTIVGPFIGKMTLKLICIQIFSADQSCTLLIVFSYSWGGPHTNSRLEAQCTRWHTKTKFAGPCVEFHSQPHGWWWKVWSSKVNQGRSLLELYHYVSLYQPSNVVRHNNPLYHLLLFLSIIKLKIQIKINQSRNRCHQSPKWVYVPQHGKLVHSHPTFRLSAPIELIGPSCPALWRT